MPVLFWLWCTTFVYFSRPATTPEQPITFQPLLPFFFFLNQLISVVNQADNEPRHHAISIRHKARVQIPTKHTRSTWDLPEDESLPGHGRGDKWGWCLWLQGWSKLCFICPQSALRSCLSYLSVSLPDFSALFLSAAGDTLRWEKDTDARVNTSCWPLRHTRLIIQLNHLITHTSLTFFS